MHLGDPGMKEQLRLLLAKLEAEEAGSTKTIRELWDEWVPWAERHVASWRVPKSCRWALENTEYEPGKRLFDLRWSELTAHIWKEWCLAARSKNGGREIADTTKDNHLTALQQMFNWHVERGSLPRNPAHGFGRLSNGEPTREGYYTPEQLERLIMHAKPLLRLMLKVAIQCGGMRVSEVSLLRKDEIDWEAREIVLPPERCKNKAGKVILITDESWEILCAQRTLSPSQYLFPHPSPYRHRQDPHVQGGPVPLRTIEKWMQYAREAAGIKLVGGELPVFHHVRHSFYVNNLNVDEPPPLHWLMEQAGHKSWRIAKRYAGLRGQAAKDRMRAKMGAAHTVSPPKTEDRMGPKKKSAQRPHESREADTGSRIHPKIKK